MRHKVWIVAVESVLLASCTQRASTPSSSVPPTPSRQQLAAATLPFDARQLVGQVQHRWAADGAELTARDRRYEAQLGVDGLRFLPGRRLADGRVERAGRPLVLRTARVEIGSTVAYREPTVARRPVEHGACAERALAPGLTEIFEARDGHVEQSWRLDQLPTRDELVIDVAVWGAAWAGRSGERHMFRERGSRVGVSYGVARARDAAGLGVTVVPERTAAGLRIRVPRAFVARAALPIVVDPTIGAEFAMDTALARNSAEDQTAPRVATSGTEYLVVWSDYRQLDGRNHIYGARVSAAGALLDPTGIEISTTPNQQDAPDVTFGGGTYLVVWHESGSSPATLGSDLYGTRVSTAGVVQDLGGIKITGATGNQSNARVAFGGAQFLVVWHSGGNGNDVYAARVSSAGVVTDTTPIAVSTGSGHQQNPDVAANGSDFLVVWWDTRNPSSTSGDDIYGARIKDDGTVLDAGGIQISGATGTQRNPTVTSNGTHWLVAWEDGRNYNITFWDLYAARVKGDGTVEEPAGIKVSAWGGDETTPRLASDGTDFLALWTDATVAVPGSYGGARIKADGTLLDATGFQVAINGLGDLVYNSTTTHYFVPRQGSGLSTDVLARRIKGDGTAVDTTDLTVSMAYNAQYYPAIAFDGTNYLVVWSDTRNWASSGFDIYGVRVSSSGAVLDPSGLVICSANGTQTYPHVAFDGTNFFAVWEDRRPGTNYADIYGGRISPAGVQLDGQGAQLSGQLFDQLRPRVAFDNKATYLVVWQDARNSQATPARGQDIFATRVRSSDAFVYEQLSGIQISSQLTNENDPDVAFDGINFVVVWSDNRTSGNGYDIYSARVDQGGSVLDPAGKLINGSVGDQTMPSIVFGGTNYLVAWQDGRTYSTTGYDVYATWLTPLVAPLSAAGIVVWNGAGDQTRPRVSRPGKAPLIVWEDRSSFDSAKFNIRGARVGASAILESFNVSVNTDNEIRPVAGAGAGNAGLFAYMHYDTTLKTVRVVARTYLETCSTAPQCPPGTTCSGGICVTCDTNAACGPSCVACGAGTICDGTTCQPCNTPAACGPSCVACGGSTPLCTGSACVQCIGAVGCTPPQICSSFVCVTPAPDLGPDKALPDASAPDTAPAADTTVGKDASTADAAREIFVGDLSTHKDASAKDRPAAEASAVDALSDVALRADAVREAAAADGRPRADAGPGSSGGCSCTVDPEGSSSPLLLLALLGVLGWRRRARR